MTDDAALRDLRSALAKLTERVSRLEERPPAPATATPAPAAGDFWALDVLRRRMDAGGRVAYAGSVRTPGGLHYEWQEEYEAAHLASVRWSAAASGLAALGHPVRLTLLRALYERPRTARDLGSLPDLGTSGQVYHHLRELQAAGWVRQGQRGWYEIPPDRTIPLLVVLAATGLGRLAPDTDPYIDPDTDPEETP